TRRARRQRLQGAEQCAIGLERAFLVQHGVNDDVAARELGPVRGRLANVASEQRDLLHPQDVQTQLIGVPDDSGNCVPSGSETKRGIEARIAGRPGNKNPHCPSPSLGVSLRSGLSRRAIAWSIPHRRPVRLIRSRDRDPLPTPRRFTSDWMYSTASGGVPPSACTSFSSSDLLATGESGSILSSRAEEFHLRALPEPYVNLSIHTAPDVRPLPRHSCQWANRVGFARRSPSNQSRAPLVL